MDILGTYYNYGNTYNYGDNCSTNALLDPSNECPTYVQSALFPVIAGSLREMEEAAIRMQVA
ncbi:MAG: hypothetical protein AB8U44_02130 [Aaplasma endosymbiont of Hyalomma asiaticum]